MSRLCLSLNLSSPGRKKFFNVDVCRRRFSRNPKQHDRINNLYLKKAFTFLILPNQICVRSNVSFSSAQVKNQKGMFSYCDSRPVPVQNLHCLHSNPMEELYVPVRFLESINFHITRYDLHKLLHPRTRTHTTRITRCMTSQKKYIRTRKLKVKNVFVS